VTIPKRIVDAHHHLWDLSANNYPWLMQQGVERFFGNPTPIQKDYLVADLVRDFGSLPVSKSVHVQVGVCPGDRLSETQWLQSVANVAGFPHAIIADIDLTAGNLKPVLAEHCKAGNFRGVRQIVGRSGTEDAKTGSGQLLSDPAFQAGLGILAASGLSFDLQLVPSQMEACASLLAHVPDLSVALCHAGSLADYSERGLAEWEHGLSKLAKHGQMLCKISGFGMFNHGWTTDSIQGPVLKAIDIFGTDRISFGSNFPVDKLYASYERVMGAYLDITSSFSGVERDAMFYDNAARFYRL
jgi:predicted TIM-barrel fold metal-dependent hydrolase